MTKMSGIMPAVLCLPKVTSLAVPEVSWIGDGNTSRSM